MDDAIEVALDTKEQLVVVVVAAVAAFAAEKLVTKELTKFLISRKS